MDTKFIVKTTRLVAKVEAARQRWSDLDEKLSDLKRACNHQTSDGKLTVKTIRKPYHRVCLICGEDIFLNCYGKIVSVWNHFDIPKARQEEILRILRD